MYLSNLKLWNFRKYCEGPNNEPGLIVQFHQGVNVLIGENDSGKTAIIDAIRYVLKTQSGEFIQFDDKDFYQDVNGIRKDEFRIECIFDGLSDQDAGLFWEWLSWNEDKSQYLLKVWLYAKRQDNTIIPSFSAGIEGHAERMDSEARDLLKVVYFKPLRDALTDMTHGYKSRLAQILGAHELFRTKKNARGEVAKHKLETDYENLKNEIEDYFKLGGDGESITQAINGFLSDHFLLKGDVRKAHMKLTGGELTEILRLLDLIMEGNKSGLGTLNLLCIAAEMLLFNNQKRGLKLALVEELEAHLHPQYQLRLIEYISSQENNEQFILSTHSITLTSKIKLANIIVLKENNALSLSPECTLMDPSDYRFLERFLDATKANLFFAKGLILVEGDAENLLIPAIAEAIGRNLYLFGVSIVNVGSTAYKRYIRIFKRKDGKSFGMPIAVISDLDERAIEFYDDNSKDRKIPKYWLLENVRPELERISSDVDYNSMLTVIKSKTAFQQDIRMHKTDAFSPIVKNLSRMAAVLTEDKKVTLNEDILSRLRVEKTNEKANSINDDKIKIFLPNAWTLEYEIASSNLYRLLATAIKAAKREEENFEHGLSEETLMSIWEEVNEAYPDGHIKTKDEIYQIFKPLNEGSVSKAMVAQFLSGMIIGELPPVSNGIISKQEIKNILETDINLRYIVEAIKYVTPN